MRCHCGENTRIFHKFLCRMAHFVLTIFMLQLTIEKGANLLGHALLTFEIFREN